MGAGVGRDWVLDGSVTRMRTCGEEAACLVPAGGGGRGPAAREKEDRRRGALGGGKENGNNGTSDQPVVFGRNRRKEAMAAVATEILAALVICFGAWIITHNDECRRTLTVPVYSLGGVIFLYALGGVIFLMSLIGFLGAWKNVSCLLWTYLIMLFVVLVAIVFTVLAFIITNTGSGHTVPGARYKEYRLQDYSSWFVKQLNDTEKWTRLKSCLVKTDDCNNLSKRYKTAKEYKLANLTPMESGCCRPPAECGYLALNASYFDLSYHPVSANVDCKLYKNARSVRCYDCNSCKAGLAQYMKTEWRVVAIFNVILFVMLSFVYFVGCSARRNAEGGDGDAKGRGR